MREQRREKEKEHRGLVCKTVGKGSYLKEVIRENMV